MDIGFRACGVCTQTCFEEHGAGATQAALTRPPCFLLTSLEVSNNWTPIPKEFAEAYGEALRGTARIVDASGKEWPVEVGGPAKFLGFKGGWKSFVASVNVKRGDQMLFSLVSRNCFSVYVFNKLGVEVTPSPVEPAKPVGKRKRLEVKAEPVSDSDESEYEGSQSESSSDSDSETSDGEAKRRRRSGSTAEAKSNDKRKALTSKTKDGTPIEPGSMTTTYESRRRRVTQVELDRTLAAAQACNPEHPSVTIVMKPSHVYRGFWLNIPKQFARKFMPRHKTEIILQDVHGFEWPKTVWIQNDHHTGLSGGWAAFSKDHCLEEGDVCVFEILDSRNVRILVHIFRVVDVNLTPGARGGWEKTYNIVHGAGMNRQGSTRRKKSTVKRKPEKRTKDSLSDEDDDAVEDDVPGVKLYKEKLSDGISDITSEEDVKPKILSLKPIPKIKSEPCALAAVKQEPGVSPFKVKQELGEDVKPTREELQASLAIPKFEPIETSASVVKTHPRYAVVQMLGRRQNEKYPNEPEFRVALGGCVLPPSEASSICEDGNGNWWVPRSHFSPDLASCYFD